MAPCCDSDGRAGQALLQYSIQPIKLEHAYTTMWPNIYVIVRLYAAVMSVNRVMLCILATAKA